MKRRVAAQLPPAAAGQTLIAYLSQRFAYHTREEWREKILQNEIALAETVCRDPERVLQAGELLEYFPSALVEPDVRRDYRIVFADEHLLVIDKPGNLPVHPAGPYFANTLWALLADDNYGKVHFVNRLDRETSGLLIATYRPEIAGVLSKTMQEMLKKYLVLVHGHFAGKLTARGHLVPAVNSPIRKKQQFICAGEPLPAQVKAAAVETVFTPLQYNNDYTLLSAELHTGKMHQIRATLHGLGYPVVGDKLYGLNEQFYRQLALDTLSDDSRRQLVLPRQALHCSELSFVHPVSNVKLHFKTPLPEEILNLLQ